MENKQTHLKFFGIGRIVPYLGPVKKMMLVMVLLITIISLLLMAKNIPHMLQLLAITRKK